MLRQRKIVRKNTDKLSDFSPFSTTFTPRKRKILFAMKRNIIAFFLFLTLCIAATGTVFAQQRNKRVVLGNERMDSICTRLKDKRVALAVNHTSILGTGFTHLLDTLLAQKIDIRKVFAPEHGFRGTADAGATVHDSCDPKTGVPIVSEKIKNRAPNSWPTSISLSSTFKTWGRVSLPTSVRCIT